MSRAVSLSTGSKRRWRCSARRATTASRSRSTTSTSIPWRRALRARAERLGALLDERGLARVVETDSRFLLDRRRAGLSELAVGGRQRRLELLRRAVDVAAALGAPVVSMRSGAVLGPGPGERVDAADGRPRARAGARRAVGVAIGLEPEGGMLVERLDDFLTLSRRLGDPPGLGLTLDLGHCAAVEPGPVETASGAAPGGSCTSTPRTCGASETPS